VTLQEDAERLREAWLDLAYLILDTVGVVWIVRRLGLRLRPWAQERSER
jgi:hypothetical protein